MRTIDSPSPEPSSVRPASARANRTHARGRESSGKAGAVAGDVQLEGLVAFHGDELHFATRLSRAWAIRHVRTAQSELLLLSSGQRHQVRDDPGQPSVSSTAEPIPVCSSSRAGRSRAIQLELGPRSQAGFEAHGWRRRRTCTRAAGDAIGQGIARFNTSTGSYARLAQSAAGLKAVDPREHHVQDERVAAAIHSASSPRIATSADIPALRSARRSRLASLTLSSTIRTRIGKPKLS